MRDNFTVQQIVDYLLKKDPQTFKRYVEYNDDLVAIVKYYYFEQLYWCGCGRPTDAIMTIWRYLDALKYKEIEDRAKAFKCRFDVEHIYDEQLLVCLAYSLDAAGFTDHGTSIYYPWLTDDGKYFCWAIEEAEIREVLDI